MMRLFIFSILFLICFTSDAQKGKIEGKVTDAATGQPLTGVSVVLKNLKGTSTDINGYYIIVVEGSTNISLTFSYNGTSQIIEGIEIAEGKTTVQDLALQLSTHTVQEVVVKSTSTARKETAASLISFQKNTNTVASVVSAEAIRRSPDRTSGDVLKRIPGASIQEGKFIIVRGLADRYNQAMINGILLTSTEPDRKTFSFDLIPSSMIDNIIINKAFVPELPGEWAGGLIQVNTKDIPSKNFFNIQLGSGINTQVIGKDFYRDKSGKLDWLGIEDGSRALPSAYTTKTNFALLSRQDKTDIGKQMKGSWVAEKISAPFNLSLQINGGFKGKFFNKTVGGNFGLSYSRNHQRLDLLNRQNKISSGFTSVEVNFNDERFNQSTVAGAFGSLAFQFNPKNKISLRSIINVNANSSITQRAGVDVSRADSILKGTEMSFRQNTFFTTQLSGEHIIASALKLKWYSAFNILDGYIPNQRRILYSKSNVNDPYRAIIANSLSQQSGSRIYQSLSDYIYTAGGDLQYEYNWFNRKQFLKGGYMFQVKDRLYDAQLFANYLPYDNDSLRRLSPDQIFSSQNFGTGEDNKFAFDALSGKTYRYMANTILNAGYIQSDNQFTDKLKLVYGLRVEHFDQLVGSVKSYDSRHTHTVVTDFLPALNINYKLNNKTNIRAAVSKTVIRPELRELAFLNLYDFELNASVQGNPALKRTAITNLDLRYELYPRAGEVFSAGVFYKNFKNPIEQLFNEGGGGSSTFSYQNAKKAITYGAELEIRKKLDQFSALENFTVQANAAYIYSRVKDEKFQVNRSLQGQSPYVFNLGLMYDYEQKGMTASILYNQVGERIYLVGDISAGAGSPDIYEASRPLIDVQITKKVLRSKGELRLNVSDVFNKKQYFYQNTNDKKTFQKNTDAYRFTRKFGTGINFSFNYSL